MLVKTKERIWKELTKAYHIHASAGTASHFCACIEANEFTDSTVSFELYAFCSDDSILKFGFELEQVVTEFNARFLKASSEIPFAFKIELDRVVSYFVSLIALLFGTIPPESDLKLDISVDMLLSSSLVPVCC